MFTDPGRKCTNNHDTVSVELSQPDVTSHNNNSASHNNNSASHNNGGTPHIRVPSSNSNIFPSSSNNLVNSPVPTSLNVNTNGAGPAHWEKEKDSDVSNS